LVLFDVRKLNGLKAIPSLKDYHVVVVSEYFLITIAIVDLYHFSLTFSNEDVASLDQGFILVVEVVKVFVWVVNSK